MAVNFSIFQKFKSFKTQVRTFAAIAVVLSGAIAISSVNLANQLRAQDKLLSVAFNRSERGLTQLGRETLKLAVLVKASGYKFNQAVAQQQADLVTSRMRVIRTHSSASDFASDATTEERQLLYPRWDQLQPNIERWLAQPDDPVARTILHQDLIEFERLTNNLADQYSLERREQYFSINGLRRNAIALLVVNSILFVIFVLFAVVVTARFICEHHQMLSLVRQKERQYRRIIQTSEEGIWLLDLHGKTTFANQKMADLLGLTGPELRQATLWDFFASDPEVDQAQAYLKRLRDGERSPYDIQLTRSDGQMIWLLTNGVPIFDEAGQDTGTLCMLTDVTTRKQFEQELQVAKQRAEFANQAKSDFLACMSHELRTPLNGILGYAQVLQRSHNLSAEENNGINTIYHCGSHLLTLINDILDVSKIEAQKLELVPTPLNLPNLLQNVVEICQIRAKQKGIQFIYASNPYLPQHVKADEKRLQQVLINLLGNAIKFTDQGSVTLVVDLLEHSTTDAMFSFHIIDTGIGIAEADLKGLFRAFEQVGDRRRYRDGTGLGLAISQHLVQLMGGKIHVISQLGQGSEFSFNIRLAVTASPPALEQAQATMNDSRVDHQLITSYQALDTRFQQEKHFTILVIDDRSEHRAVFSNLLEPIGFSVITADNGPEGLDKLHTLQPDIIITDIVMPDMGGIEFLRQVRCQDQLKHLPIIVSSASVSLTDQQIVLENGGTAFLAKPVNSTELFQLLATHLNLEWVYMAQDSKDSGAVKSTLPDLVLPPTRVLQQLLDLAERDNVRMLRQHLEHLVETNETYRPFAEKITQLAKRFQTEEIETLLQNYLAEGVVNAG
ncbi:MAG: PAS domain S-box protein [Cyanothece sp. SIO2G6]|nr:PAS domain S-box protein [Cyanothece sp. SIO2G6]